MPSDFIALDWGTTSLRAYLATREGEVLETRGTPQGILAIEGGAFEPVFERAIEGWDRALPVLASGMITSRQGWREVSYVQAPASLAEVASGVLRFETGGKRTIHFVPGLSFRSADGVPDVIRGEETQVLGLNGGGSGLVVTRGTHCKWIEARNGGIHRFSTFMTGEMFAVLRAHSILGRLMEGEGGGTGEGFGRGVRAGLGAPQGELLHKLFSVRTLGLMGDVPPPELADYLSGLLIGSEIAGGRMMYGDARAVKVIGSPAIAAPFVEAARIAGIEARLVPDGAAVRGLSRIGQQLGVIA